MELTMSMFATQADYWKARAELAEKTVAEVAAELKCEPDNEKMLQAVHNLNWALGTPGYAEMATPEEQAEHEAACVRIDDVLARMERAKAEHDAMVRDAMRYRWLRDCPWPARVESVVRCHSNLIWDTTIDAAIDAAMAELAASGAA